MRIFILLPMLLLFTHCQAQTTTTHTMKLIYIYDALCGWCYGFSPTIQRFAQEHQSTFAVQVVSGGMVTGSRIAPISSIAAYIEGAYQTVERTTGIKFGEPFLKKTLKEGTAVFTSIPPALALSAFKELKPDETLAFAAQIQKAIYYHGMEPADTAAYGKLAADFGLNSEEFISQMQTAATLHAAEQDFALSDALGVTGFPSVFVEYAGKYYPLASGAVSFETLEKQFQQL
ncbi:MAG TPA: DsbA family protein, partial [Chitinophagales bacterium]|nr:DsbA family protein [Chitinophagales bacterium]